MIKEGWALICLGGLWGWIFATICFILNSFTSIGTFRGSQALLWGVAIVVFYFAWFIGMSNV